MKQKKILITDDDPGIQDIFKLIFEREGYDVTILTEGTALMNNNFEIPDVILLDIQLSGMDGLTICKHLKSSVASKDIPVIMISASPGLSKISKQAGADDFIEKPFCKKDLLTVVEKYIMLKEAV